MTQPSEILPPNTPPPPQGAKLAPGALTPLFPDFKPLEMSDRPAIEAFTAQFEPYSDFCFSTLTFYNINNSTHWCWLNGNLVLRFCDAFGPGTYLTFLGVQKPADTAASVIDYARRMNYSPTLCRVPDVTAQAIKNETECLRIEDDRAGFDYVYRVGPLTRLRGHTYATTRRKVKIFQHRHPGHQFPQLDLSHPAGIKHVRSTLAAWRPRDQKSGTSDAYRTALEVCLSHASAFDLVALGLVIDAAPVAFHLAERIHKSWLIIHFTASDPNYGGASTFLFHHLAQYVLDMDIQHMNYQEDMGLSGLQMHKIECSPCSFLRKFRVSKAE